ncbi:hypothetical protein GE253_22660 [Niveispirillum sp. SYP-B3756]|uniref:RebB family R body protein n=1 Tax=Niveispirillum sp. SYP-B3756 TaxID=2662178 RepID=UPI0012923A2F|nr:RebB family R body protein [Niveispirillum sp. SYP-B3756]MQP68123.1 hypothetical protein [Niveispirillum sp. SYP-B3756]
MADGSSVPAVTAVDDVTVINVAMAPSIAMGMVYTSTAQALGLAMANATANQQRGQAIGEAVLGRVVTMILQSAASP